VSVSFIERLHALQAAVTHGNIACCIAFAALNFHFFGGQGPSTHNFQPHFVSLLFYSLLNLKK
jgi:hypothetical protein